MLKFGVDWQFPSIGHEQKRLWAYKEQKMMMYSRIAPLALLAGAALALAACSGGSSRLDAGQRISARGDAISGRGDAWNNGQRDVQAGQKALQKSADRAADGEEELRRARDAAAKAERKIQMAQTDRLAAEQRIGAGQAEMSRAEADYTAIRNQPSVLQPR
jgi:hypothetical protein